MVPVQGISYSGKEKAIELLPDGGYRLGPGGSCRRSSDGKSMVIGLKRGLWG